MLPSIATCVARIVLDRALATALLLWSPPVSNTLLIIGALELLGLGGLFAWVRVQARRRAAGKERPSRPVRIMVALLGLLVIVAFPILMVTSIVSPATRSERLHDKLVQMGTPAVAEITHLEETGTVINRRPEVRVRMTVRPKHAASFTAQAIWPFSVQDVQSYRIGSRVKVYFDPADHDATTVVGIASPAD